MLLKEFFVKLGLDVDVLAFTKAQLAVEGLRYGLNLLKNAAISSVKGLFNLVDSVGTSAKSIQKAAQIAGVSTTAFQELGFASKNPEMLTQGLIRLSRSMMNASEGQKTFVKAFSEIGVKATDAHGKLRPTDEVLLDIAEKFHSMPDGAKKTALAMEAFGRGGATLIPFLNKGKDGIEALRKEARELGVVLDDATIKSGSEYKDSIYLLDGAIQGLKNSIGGPLLGVFTDLVKQLAVLIKENKDIIKLGLGSLVKVLVGVLKGLFAILTAIGKIARFVIDSWKPLTVILGTILFTILVPMIPTLLTVAAGWVAAGAAAVASGLAAAAAWVIAAAPVILLAALFATLILYVQDFYTFLNGGDSIIGRLLTKWGVLKDGLLEPINPDDSWLVKVLKATIYGLQHWDQILGMIKDTILGFFSWLWETVVGFFKSIGEAIENVFIGIFSWLEQKIIDFGVFMKDTFLSALEPLKNIPGIGGYLPTANAGMSSEDAVKKMAAFAMQINAAQFGGGQNPFATPVQNKSSTVNNSISIPINVAQQPGEDSKDFAEKVYGLVQTHLDTHLLNAFRGVAP